MVWNGRFGVQDWLEARRAAPSSTTLPAPWWCMPWAAGSAWPRCCCWARAPTATARTARISAHPPSSIPFLALGAWILAVGWFGFNVMSAQTIDKISGLVAVNSLMAMVGGTLAATLVGPERPGLRSQRPAGRAGGGVRRLRPDAPAGRAGGRRRRRRDLRQHVHADAEPLEDRRRARRVAVARPVRRLGRHRRRHLRQPRRWAAWAA